MLREGQGAFADYPKYRKSITDLIWLGKVGEPEKQSAEDQVQAAKESIGTPMPEDQLDEARKLRERLNANRAKREE